LFPSEIKFFAGEIKFFPLHSVDLGSSGVLTGLQIFTLLSKVQTKSLPGIG
jgi:hypothetical protein